MTGRTRIYVIVAAALAAGAVGCEDIAEALNTDQDAMVRDAGQAGADGAAGRDGGGPGGMDGGQAGSDGGAAGEDGGAAGEDGGAAGEDGGAAGEDGGAAGEDGGAGGQDGAPPDRCEGVNCPIGESCNPANGACEPDVVDPCEGVNCPIGERCNARTGVCEPEGEDLCAGVRCLPGEACDPATGQCEARGDASCEDVCGGWVDCELLEPADLAGCIEGCTADSFPEERECIVAAGCDVDAVDACLGEEPPPDLCENVECPVGSRCDRRTGDCIDEGDAPTCDDICNGWVDCGFQAPEDVPECVLACEEDGPVELRVCLGEAGCDPDALDACFEEPPPPDLCADVLCPPGTRCDPQSGRCVGGGAVPSCEDLCQGYVDCEFMDPADVDACVTECTDVSFPEQRQCVGDAGCDVDALTACFEEPPPPDLCAGVLCPPGSACDPTSGQCVDGPSCEDVCDTWIDCEFWDPADHAGCLEACVADTFPPVRVCLMEAGCDVDAALACLEAEPPPDLCADVRCPPGTGCDPATGACVPGGAVPTCREICEGWVDCGFAAPEDVAGCIEGCTADSFPEQRRCIGEAACDVDAVNACFDEPPPPDVCVDVLCPPGTECDPQTGECVGGGAVPSCREICEGWVDCGFGTPDDVPGCVDDCDAVSNPALRQCIGDAACDGDAIDACFEAPPPVDLCDGVLCPPGSQCDPGTGRCVGAGVPDCVAVCDVWLDCEFIVDPAECLVACRAGTPPEVRTCLVDAACDMPALEACFDEPPPLDLCDGVLCPPDSACDPNTGRCVAGGAAPTCAETCAGMADCEFIAPEDVEQCTAECVEFSWPAQRQCLGEAGCDVDAASACFDLEPPDRCVGVVCPEGLVCDPASGRCGGGGACEDDELEQNDDLDGARAVEPDVWAGLAICADDADWYAVQVCDGGTLTVTLEFTHDDGDIDVVILDADAGEIDGSDTSDDNELVSVDGLPGGEYYVVVYGYQGAENTYDMAIEVDCP